MKGDFTRDTFDARRQFTRVLMQQGRVQLDADWNEQASILLHYLRGLAADLIGPHGGPTDNLGFDISAPSGTQAGDFAIGPGVYYVNGIRCEAAGTSYSRQIDYPLTDDDKLKEQPVPYLAYLEVWERHVTYNEFDGIREVALGGPDTTTRTQLVQQVRTLLLADKIEDPTNVDWFKNHQPPYSAEERRALIEMGLPLLVFAATIEKDPTKRAKIEANIADLRTILAALDGARLKARAFVAQPSTDPCTISPDARFRGAENQLYRVEIHRSGGVWDGRAAPTPSLATFKWSREDGSAVFPIIKIDDKVVTLAHLGRDDRFGLREGDCVEVSDNDYVVRNRAEQLLFVTAIDRDRLQVTLDGAPGLQLKPGATALLRRWDHNGRVLRLDDGAALILEGAGADDNWMELEDGVQVQFQAPASGAQPNQYRTGDYWLIPARTATGDVEWPGPSDNPVALPPHGFKHHYAPLRRITVDGSGTVKPDKLDLRRRFDAQATIIKP